MKQLDEEVAVPARIPHCLISAGSQAGIHRNSEASLTRCAPGVSERDANLERASLSHQAFTFSAPYQSWSHFYSGWDALSAWFSKARTSPWLGCPFPMVIKGNKLLCT